MDSFVRCFPVIEKVWSDLIEKGWITPVVAFLIEKGWITSAVAFSVALLFWKAIFPLLIYYFDRREKYHDFAKEIIKESDLSKDVKDLLRERLEMDAFFKYYGIRADRFMRHSLISFYEINK